MLKGDKMKYNGVSLSGIPDNETPNLVICYPDKIYPEFWGLFIRNFIPIPDKFRLTRPPNA